MVHRIDPSGHWTHKTHLYVIVDGDYNNNYDMISISYCTHARALTDINERRKVRLPKQLAYYTLMPSNRAIRLVKDDILCNKY